MHLIDTHAHLFDESLVGDLPGVLTRASQAGVRQVINVATTAASTLTVRDIAKRTLGVFATAGIHPNYANQAVSSDYQIIEEAIRDSSVVAIGETGLDRYWDDCPWEVQLENFAAHIKLSSESGLPLIIHTRDCYPEMISVLKENSSSKSLRGVMHSFAGSASEAEQLLELGMHISFAGMLTFKKSDELREVAKVVPMDRLLVETDSPYLSPEPFRGKKPNEPSRVVYTASKLAEAKGITLFELAEGTSRSARRLFSKMTDDVISVH